MNRRGIDRVLWCAAAAALLIGWSSPTWAQPCYMEYMKDTGKPVKWPMTPIKYYTYINGGQLPDKAKVLEAIKAAFQSYQDVACATLEFEHAGEETELIADGKEGAILVYFGHDDATWIYNGTKPLAYFRDATFDPAVDDTILKSIIAMNAKDFKWTTDGAATDTLDVQTVVTQMIPNAIGFHGSDDPVKGSLAAIKFNYEQRDLTDAQKNGAIYSYFDENAAECTKPDDPGVCAGSEPASDGGTPVTDGGPTTDTTTPPPTDATTPPPGDGTTEGDGQIGGDATHEKDDDDGCCRVSHARTSSLPYMVLIALSLMVGLRRRRRK